MANRKKKFLNFNKFSLIPLIDGMDLYLSMSIATFLAIFFFENLETSFSLILITFIILINFFIRFFTPLFVKSANEKIQKINPIFLLCLSFFLPVILLSDFLSISLVIFIFSRVLVGFSFSLLNLNYLNSELLKEDENFFLKYFLIFILGLILGSFCFLIIDDIFSNQELNSWAWKIVYFFLSIFTLLFALFFKFKKYSTNLQNLNFHTSVSLKSIIKKFIQNFFVLIPFLTFIIFASSKWLPKFSNPENMQFLEFNIINIILIVMFSFFFYPLINLIGKMRSKNFLIPSIILISIISFFFEYSSSYSINLLKFFISLIASFCLCMIYQTTRSLKDLTSVDVFRLQNIIYLSSSLLTPILFYYFINFSISYNIVYLVVGLFFLITLVFEKYGKK